MSIFNSIWLGIVQGLSEFLPISSSAHLQLFSELFKVDLSGDNMHLFIVLLHTGTMIAVLLCYWRRVWLMIKHPVLSDLKWLVVATIPTVVYALIKPDFPESFERSLMPFAFLLTAFMLYMSDYLAKLRDIGKTAHKDVKWYDVLAMGFMQIIGTFMGVSRSGSTLFGGLATGLHRKNAADFCFLMSIPAVCGAVVLDMYEIYKSEAGFAVIGEIGTVQIAAGIAAAVVCGILAIKFMLFLVKKISLKWFSLYTAVLGLVLIFNDFFFKWW